MRDLLIVAKHVRFEIGIGVMILTVVLLSVGVVKMATSPMPPIQPGLDNPSSGAPVFTDGIGLVSDTPFTFVFDAREQEPLITIKYIVQNGRCHVLIQTLVTSGTVAIGSNEPCVAEGLME